MSKSILNDLANLGQSLWIDNINRTMIEKGQLKSLIDQGLRGQTSNPTIFKQAISSSNDYDQRIQSLSEKGASTFEIYDELTVKDVADAADLFKEVFQKTNGLDGYVSLEINPKLANEYESQLSEGLRLWKKLNRPNVMIKVPASKNGIRVVEALIAKGVNVNVTLIFSAEQYTQVIWAYIKGLKVLKQSGGDLSKVRSVASVFVSRVDTVVDKWLDEHNLPELKGKAAVSNCEIIYHKFEQAFKESDFIELKNHEANIQRVLWASTGTKDPKYSDIKYVSELIANHTVNTLPDKTLMAVLDHGIAKISLPSNVAQSQQIITTLRDKGIDVGIVCNKLLEDGILAFESSFDELTNSIEEKLKKLCIRS